MTHRPPFAPDPDADETIDALDADETIDGADLLAHVRAELASSHLASEIGSSATPRSADTRDHADRAQGPTRRRPATDQPDEDVEDLEDVELTLGADDFARHRPSRRLPQPAAPNGVPVRSQPFARSQPPTRWHPPAPPAPAASRRSVGRLQILAILAAVVFGLVATAMIWRQVDGTSADRTRSSPVPGDADEDHGA